MASMLSAISEMPQWVSGPTEKPCSAPKTQYSRNWSLITVSCSGVMCSSLPPVSMRTVFAPSAAATCRCSKASSRFFARASAESSQTWQPSAW